MLAFATPGPVELTIILVIVVLIFGAGKLPKIAGQLGDAIRGFKKGVAGVEDEKADLTRAVLEPPKPAAQTVEVEVESSQEETP